MNKPFLDMLFAVLRVGESLDNIDKKVFKEFLEEAVETFNELETLKHQYFTMEKHYRETKGIPENETLGQVAKELKNIGDALHGLCDLKLNRGN